MPVNLAAPARACHGCGSASFRVGGPPFMIEPIMFFGIGFFVASLFGLVLIPLVHNRAVRLTMKRLEAATPLSMAEIQADKDRVAGHEREAQEVSDRLARERKDAATATAELQEERGKVEKLSDRVSQLERALVAQTTEAEVLGRRVQEIESRMTDQVKVLSEREIEITQLRDKLAQNQKVEADLRAELAGGPCA